MPGATGWGDSQPQSILGQPPAGKRSAEEDLDIDELQSGVFGQQAGPEMVEARGGRRKEEKKERGKGPQVRRRPKAFGGVCDERGFLQGIVEG